jgi:hypothetical protein
MGNTSKPRHTRRVATLAAALAIGAGAMFTGGNSLASPPSGCAYDRPCIDDAYYTKSRNVYVTWTATESFSHYNVIWWRRGKARVQVERPGGRSGWIRIRNVNAWTTYKFLVQGCNKPFLGSSECSPWEPAEVEVRSFTR